jgi:hypothetical protein
MHDSSYNKSAGKVSNDRLATKEQIPLISQVRGRTRAYCPRCERPVQLITDSRAEDLFKCELPELLSLATRGILHRLHNSKGVLMFCGDSLFRCFSDRPTKLLTDQQAVLVRCTDGNKAVLDPRT